MLKMYRPTAEQLLLLAIYHQEHTGYGLEQVSERIRHKTFKTAPEMQAFNLARKSAKLVGTTKEVENWPQNLIDSLLKGLVDDDSKRADVDLIDQMVRALQLPHCRNVLSGESMRRLRSAILLPSEMAGLNGRLAAREMSCSQCSLPLHDRESVTILRTGEGTQTLVCHRCVAPSQVPCASCEETAALSSKAMNAMSRMQCPACSAKKASALKPAPAEEEVALPGNPVPTFRTATAGTFVPRAGRSVAVARDPGPIPGPPPTVVQLEGLDMTLPILDRVRVAQNMLGQAIFNGIVPPGALADLGDGVRVNAEGTLSEGPRGM